MTLAISGSFACVLATSESVSLTWTLLDTHHSHKEDF
jgi:hypothetical protein